MVASEPWRSASKPLPDRSRQSLRRWLLVAIVLLAFGLRVFDLNDQSLWGDEINTLERAETAPAELLDEMPVEHMPLYFWHLYGWVLGAGDTDFALRFPSVVWGTLSVAL